jgi:hypothetical protein
MMFAVDHRMFIAKYGLSRVAIATIPSSLNPKWRIS